MAHQELKENWELVKKKLSVKFADGDTIDVDSIIYLIGIQELGQGYKTFTKDEKLELMHIAICKILIPFGYYEFTHIDKDGWPHYNLNKELPFLKAGEQTILLKKAIVQYFIDTKFI